MIWIRQDVEKKEYSAAINTRWSDLAAAWNGI